MKSLKARFAALAAVGIAAALLTVVPSTGASAAPGHGVTDNAVAAANMLSRAEAAQLPSAYRANSVVSGEDLDGVCHSLDACYFWASNFGGSLVDIFFAEPSHWPYFYISPGAGQGQVLANNAASAINADNVYYLVICTGINYTGSCYAAPPLTGGNFVAGLFLNNESHYWV